MVISERGAKEEKKKGGGGENQSNWGLEWLRSSFSIASGEKKKLRNRFWLWLSRLWHGSNPPHWKLTLRWRPRHTRLDLLKPIAKNAKHEIVLSPAHVSPSQSRRLQNRDPEAGTREVESYPRSNTKLCLTVFGRRLQGYGKALELLTLLGLRVLSSQTADPICGRRLVMAHIPRRTEQLSRPNLHRITLECSAAWPMSYAALVNNSLGAGDSASGAAWVQLIILWREDCWQAPRRLSRIHLDCSLTNISNWFTVGTLVEASSG